MLAGFIPWPEERARAYREKATEGLSLFDMVPGAPRGTRKMALAPARGARYRELVGTAERLPAAAEAGLKLLDRGRSPQRRNSPCLSCLPGSGPFRSWRFAPTATPKYAIINGRASLSDPRPARLFRLSADGAGNERRVPDAQKGSRGR
jgi:hypothetical protein